MCRHCGGYNTRVLAHHRLPKYDANGNLQADEEGSEKEGEAEEEAEEEEEEEEETVEEVEED